MLMVFLYHLDLSWFSGGFLGVDVFFVISGFLISKLLLNEYATSQTISLSEFYARRVRRILPSATIVIVGTVFVSRITLEPLRLANLSWDAIASSSFWANALFADRAVDYLGASLPPSPLQHYWSLSVEEQFYLVFPAILIFSLRLARHDRRIPLIMLTSCGIVSLMLAVFFTSAYPVFSFFHLPTRAWQFIAGAIIPLTRWQTSYQKLSCSTALPVTGLLILLLSTTTFDQSTSYPGIAALIPTTGALLLVLSATSSGAVSHILSHPALTALGSRSFALYLWHWPVIVFVKSGTQSPLRLPDICLVVALSAFLTEVTHRLVENPFRFSQFFTSRRRNSFALAVVLVIVGVVAGVVNGKSSPLIYGSLNVPASTSDQLPTLLSEASRTIFLPENLEPTLENVFEAEPTIYRLGCHDYDSDTPITCDIGNPNSRVRLALFGDSHAAQWFDPISQIVTKNNWYLLSITRSGCSPLPQLMPTKCEKWFDSALTTMKQRNIRTVIVSSLINGADYSPNVLRDSLESLQSQLLKIDTLPVFLEDTPRPQEHVPICLSSNTENITRCNLSRDTSVTNRYSDLTRGIFDSTASTFIPTEQWFCVDGICPAVIGNSVVYRDDSHISPRYAELLTPQLEQVITSILF